MVEIIPKKPKKALHLENILLYISGAFLLIVILSYVVLVNFENKASISLEGLKGKIAQLGTPEDKILEEKVFQNGKKIRDFSTLMSERRFSSKFFENFEKLSLPKIWFSEIDLEPIKMEATVLGHAPDFQIVGQQLIIFKNQEAISEVNLQKLTTGKDGGAEFILFLSFKPELFTTTTVAITQ